ncbi:HesB/YadR/YfhF family protein [Bacillus sp. FJAT-44742]|uniref:HesB/YadR/YfhF family protein n=1 Tax=Bacillus sp. FJAT-44742 TaxID=2014005 RepID=UPI000C25157E|nr:HesB/YadR/YfhF family protein [Bacillus sp. FJAT-44742]
MEITISQPALKWFEEEMELKQGDSIRFFVRYGGHAHIHTGFSLGVGKEAPFEPAASLEKNHCLFYVEEKDMWFFKDHNLQVKYSRKAGEIEFEFPPRS